MKIKNSQYDVGVIVGRFQISELTEGHKNLFNYVFNEHEKIIIFLGLSPCKTTVNNPLDFESRKQMLTEELKEYTNHEISIMYIKDRCSDELWSKELDSMINDLIGPSITAVLYGCRDSFISSYKGNFPVHELTQDSFSSGTEQRKMISKKVKSSYDLRCGVIWATLNQYTGAIPTVDIAIFNDDKSRLLLARKEDETKYRFVGGFASGKSSYEEDAKREVMEETSIIEIGDLKYEGSFLINDWRYKNEKNKIVTIFYSCKMIFGRPEPSDDICELKWFNVSALKTSFKDLIIETHQPLIEKLLS